MYINENLLFLLIYVFYRNKNVNRIQLNYATKKFRHIKNFRVFNFKNLYFGN